MRPKVQILPDPPFLKSYTIFMKIEINNEIVLRCISEVYRIVNRRNIKSILSHVKITSTKGMLYFYTTDLELFMQKKLPFSVDEKISIAVPIFPLYQILRALDKNANIVLLFYKTNGKFAKLFIKASNINFSLPCTDVKDFPCYEEGKYTSTFFISSAKIKFLFSRVKHAIATDNTQYCLNGGYLHIVEVKNFPMLRMVATDGHRLALAEVSISSNINLMPNIILPIKCINELNKLLEINTCNMRISVAQNTIQFCIGDIILVSKLIDARFPHYQLVIPQTNKYLLEVDVKSFVRGLELTVAVISTRQKTVIIRIQNNKMVLFVNDKHHSSAVIEIKTSYGGPEMKFAFDIQYLLEALSLITSLTVKIYLKSNIEAVLLEDSNNTNCQFVLMPLCI